MSEKKPINWGTLAAKLGFKAEGDSAKETLMEAINQKIDEVQTSNTDLTSKLEAAQSSLTKATDDLKLATDAKVKLEADLKAANDKIASYETEAGNRGLQSKENKDDKIDAQKTEAQKEIDALPHNQELDNNKLFS